VLFFLLGRTTLASVARFTSDVTAVIIAAKRSGASDRAAAQQAGVSHVAILKWVHRGEHGEARYADFAKAYREAELVADAAGLNAIFARFGSPCVGVHHGT
jgi:hypothetical protein